jgi:hypothetical protein
VCTPNVLLALLWPGIGPFLGVYLPWLYVTLAVILGGNPIMDLMGIAAGHLYYFLMVGPSDACAHVFVQAMFTFCRHFCVRGVCLLQIVLPENAQYGVRLLRTPQFLYVCSPNDWAA